MKKFIYSLIAIISVGLCSCGSSDNSCIREIASIIDEAAQKEQEFNDAVTSGEKSESDFNPEEVFITPDGNVFANTDIKTIIEQHTNYKLTPEDKEMLKASIDKLCPEVPVRYQTTEAGQLLDKLKSAMRNKNLTNIDAAQTLGDLL